MEAKKHCPDCGAFTTVRTKDIVLGTRPGGKKLMGSTTVECCTKCEWTGKPSAGILDYAREEARAGRLALSVNLQAGEQPAVEIIAYIRANPNSFIGVSLRPNPGKEIHARFVNMEYGTQFDRYDVVAALKYLVDTGEMQMVGTWGFGPDSNLYAPHKQNV